MKLPRVQSPRLIPVVIAATAALLLFKGIALIGGGTYVIGTTPVQAEEHKAAAGADPTVQVTGDPNAVDTSPTIADTTANLPTAKAEGGGHGGEAAAGTEAAPADGEHAAAGDAAPADAGHGEAPATDAAPAAPATLPYCEPVDPSKAEKPKEGEAAHAPAAAETPAAPPTCTPLPTNGSGDAVPMMTNGQGQVVPLADGTGAATEQQVTDRLGQRRTELDKRQADLDMRESLIQAAEKQLDDQTAALKALQDQLNAKVEANDAADKEQLASLVATYETMKPKDAAVIFSQLDMPTLVRLAKAINPRKLGPILAKMDTAKAEALTANLAANAKAVQPTTPVAADPNALPQIVGK